MRQHMRAINLRRVHIRSEALSSKVAVKQIANMSLRRMQIRCEALSKYTRTSDLKCMDTSSTRHTSATPDNLVISHTSLLDDILMPVAREQCALVQRRCSAGGAPSHASRM